LSFTYRETQIVKGMLARGDKQHDIAAFFGVNGGRVAEVANGSCDYPTAPAAEESKLPPPGPYVSLRTVFEVREILKEAVELIAGAGDVSGESELALDALQNAIKKLA
jgi:hypothetical protein